MPTVREFKQKNKKRVSHYRAEEPVVRPTRAKRRPGREEVDTSDNGHDAEEAEEEMETKSKRANHKDKPAKKAVRREEHDEDLDESEDESQDESAVAAEAEAAEAGDRIEIQFKGSELLRAKFPKTFDLAEEVATQWIHDGSFEGLPIGHPLGQWAAQQGLVKAKQIEKKVVESPLFEKAAIGVLTYGMKAQGLIQKLKDRLQNR